MVTFYHTDDVAKGNITTNATNTTYNATSDYRLKDNVEVLGWEESLSRIMSIKPSSWNWKLNGLPGEGFIAHELKEFFPGAVTGNKDEVEEIGEIRDESGNLVKENVPQIVMGDYPEPDFPGYSWSKTAERPVYQSLDTHMVVAALVRTVQHQQEQIANLKQLLIDKGVATDEEVL